MAGSVHAVTITWNSAGVIGGLLDSLLAEGGSLGGIVVVDNGSKDGTAGLVRRRCPGAVLIENGENRGFAAAANQGIKAAGGDFVLLINPDVSFRPGFVGALKDALVSDPEVGAAAPRLMRPAHGVIDSAGLVMLKSRKAVDRGRDEPDTGGYDTPGRVFGACGAAALLRREMLEDTRLGGEYFDESFFSYKEDVDLAWRANLFGWKAVYVPSALATHHRGWKTSGRKDVPRLLRRHSHKNRYLCILKNDDLSNLAAHLPQVLFYEAKLLLFSVCFEPFLFLSFLDIIAMLPGVLKKRALIKGRRRLSPGRIRCLFG